MVSLTEIVEWSMLVFWLGAKNKANWIFLDCAKHENKVEPGKIGHLGGLWQASDALNGGVKADAYAGCQGEC